MKNYKIHIYLSLVIKICLHIGRFIVIYRKPRVLVGYE